MNQLQPYGIPIKMQEVSITSLDEFLERIQSTILNGGHEFLIQRSQMDKISNIELTKIIGNSQNFLTSGLIQLREEILTHEKIMNSNQQNLKQGLEKFFQIFNEYYKNLSQGIIHLAAQLKEKDTSHTERNELSILLTNIDNRLRVELSKNNTEIEQLRSTLASAQYMYPYQGITDSINSVLRKTIELTENIKEEILQNFDRNIKLIEEACAQILLDVQPLKNLPNNILRQNQSNHDI